MPLFELQVILPLALAWAWVHVFVPLETILAQLGLTMEFKIQFSICIRNAASETVFNNGIDVGPLVVPRRGREGQGPQGD